MVAVRFVSFTQLHDYFDYQANQISLRWHDFFQYVQASINDAVGKLRVGQHIPYMPLLALSCSKEANDHIRTTLKSFLLPISSP